MRHRQIQQKDVGLDLGRHFHRFETVAGLTHDFHIAFRLQEAPQSVAENRVIVGNHDAYGMSALLHGRSISSWFIGAWSIRTWFIHTWSIHACFIHRWLMRGWLIHDWPFSPVEFGPPAVRRAPESILSRVRPPQGVRVPGSLPAPFPAPPVPHPRAFRQTEILSRRLQRLVANYLPVAPAAPAHGVL